jgi:glucose-6-phosphate isomerase
MALNTINPTNTASWKSCKSTLMICYYYADVFMDVTRTAKFHLKWNDFLIDYSKNIINQETMDLLLELANELGLNSIILEIINQTENRAVLHTAHEQKNQQLYM